MSAWHCWHAAQARDDVTGRAASWRLRAADFDVVLNAKTIRGSIVGTRMDLQDALQFAGERKVRAHYSTDRLERINDIFRDMKQGRIDGRIVLQF